MDDYKRQLAEDDAFVSRIAGIQSDQETLLQDIETISTVDQLAATCGAEWRLLKRIDVLIHDLLIHEHWNPDAFESDPLETAQELLTGPRAQVSGVMSDEYDIEVTKKRLRIAAALARKIAEQLDTYVDSQVSAKQQAQQNSRW